MNKAFIHLKEGATMPRTEAANQRIREEQREKILEAARRVFARKGRAATMADVANEANVSQGLAYRYFANKEAIFHELVEQAVQAGPAALQRRLERPGTPGERLFLWVSSMVESRRERPEFFQLFDQVLSDEAMPHGLRQLVQGYARTVQDQLRHLIVEGQAEGSVRVADPDQLVRAILVYLDGLARGYTLYGPEQFNQHFPDAEILLRMLKP